MMMGTTGRDELEYGDMYNCHSDVSEFMSKCSQGGGWVISLACYPLCPPLSWCMAKV